VKGASGSCLEMDITRSFFAKSAFATSFATADEAPISKVVFI
jgi:hypothetical protein